MSPSALCARARSARVPRASGDEPIGADAELREIVCSPRERG